MIPRSFYHEARITDIPEILELYRKLMSQHHRYGVLYHIHRRALVTYRTFLIACLKDPQSIVVVAQERDRIVGFISARIHPRFSVFLVSRAVFVYDIYVCRRQRSHGIGKKLITRVHQWARRKKISFIKLEVSPHNDKAVAFWQKMGFFIFQHKMAKKV